MYKYLFLTTCGDEKNPKCVDTPMPLKEVYTGGVYSLRADLLHHITDKFYITSLLGLGIVDEDFVASWYDVPPSLLNKKSKEPNFHENHRKLFEERYPGVINNVEKVFYIGNSHYNESIKKIFPDKEVIICMDKKVTVGSFRQVLAATNRLLDGVDINHRSKYYVYKDHIFEFRTTGKEKSNHIYKIVDDKYIEVNPFKDNTNFMKKFRELTGNLTTKEYVKSVSPEATTFELVSAVVKSYFEDVLNLTPIDRLDDSKFIRFNMIDDGPFNKEFVKILKENIKKTK